MFRYVAVMSMLQEDRSALKFLGTAETDRPNVSRPDGLAFEATPVFDLLAPEPLASNGPKLAAVGGLLAVAAMVIWVSGAPGYSHVEDRSSVFQIDASRVPGALLTIDPDLLIEQPQKWAKLQMPESEKNRLLHELKTGTLRLGMVKLWDSAAEDADMVRIVAAGFSQDILLRKEPQILYVPFSPGGSVRMTAVRDGGGGVTLGVETVLGPFLMPSLAVGQSVEVPVL
jgi:hypothetical protein